MPVVFKPLPSLFLGEGVLELELLELGDPECGEGILPSVIKLVGLVMTTLGFPPDCDADDNPILVVLAELGMLTPVCSAVKFGTN